MAKDHWQIIKRDKAGRTAIGRVDNVTLKECPRAVLDCAVKAANLIGNGLYGVDLKDVEGDVKIIEINDNPNVDGGNEDRVLGDELYRRIVSGFVERIERLRT
jgi:glutathione synthase/RimK-type ligase-like ATP-grasp enzyme